MAGPLIQLLQGLRARRQRRRSGWGGGDAPGMRNMLNPLDSQDMTDRAQGVDISSSMPATRLEARISEPVADSFATSQLPQPAASTTVAPPHEESPQRRSPFMTAAGSNAVASPMTSSQCGPGGCNVGPSAGLDASQYGITLEPGQTLLRVGPEVSQPGFAAQQPVASTQAASGAQTFDPSSTFSAWQGFMKQAVEDPKNTNWAAAGLAAAQQAENFFKLHQTATNPSWKVYYGQQFSFWQRESANAFKAHQLALNLAPRQDMARQAMERGTLKQGFQEAHDFLTTPNMSVRPEDRAMAYATKVNPNLTDEQLASNPTYQEALRKAYAADIAHSAALSASDSGNFYPWGDEDRRSAGVATAWNDARKYYGGMSLEAASSEIDRHFKPAYGQSLARANSELPPEARMSDAEIRNRVEEHTLALKSILAYDKDPSLGKGEQPAATQGPAQQRQRPAQQSSDGGWLPSVRAWGG